MCVSMTTIVESIFKIAKHHVETGASFIVTRRSRDWGRNDSSSEDVTFFFPKGKEEAIVLRQQTSGHVRFEGGSVSREYTKKAEGPFPSALVELVYSPADNSKGGTIELRIGASIYSWYPPSTGPGSWEEWMDEADEAQACAHQLLSAILFHSMWNNTEGKIFTGATRKIVPAKVIIPLGDNSIGEIARITKLK